MILISVARRFLALLVAALAACLPVDAGAVTIDTPFASRYDYNELLISVTPADASSERGPPSADSNRTATAAVDRWSRGASVRPRALTTPVFYSYNGTPRFAPSACSAHGVEWGSGGRADAHRLRVAAKLAPRQIDASWGGLIKYKHGGPMTAIEHINYRHAYTSGFSNVSKYSKGTSVRNIQGYVDDALRHGSVSADGTMVRHNIGRVIGTDQLGNPVTGIQMYVRNGQIQTAFQVAWP